MISKLYDKLSNLGWRIRENNSIYPGEEVITSGKYYLIEVKTIRKSHAATENNLIWHSWGSGTMEEMKAKEKKVTEYFSVDSTCLLILNEIYVEARAFGYGIYRE